MRVGSLFLIVMRANYSRYGRDHRSKTVRCPVQALFVDECSQRGDNVTPMKIFLRIKPSFVVIWILPRNIKFLKY